MVTRFFKNTEGRRVFSGRFVLSFKNLTDKGNVLSRNSFLIKSAVSLWLIDAMIHLLGGYRCCEALPAQKGGGSPLRECFAMESGPVKIMFSF
jgi:hypothetical protein